MATALTNATVLVVDDQRETVELLTTILESRGYVVLSAYDGPQTLKMVATEKIDLILLDVSMPGLDGYEVCQLLKADKAVADIPVLFVSALNDLRVKVEGFRVGGVDYIAKPFHRDELLARIGTHVELRRKQLEIERLQQLEVARLQQTSDFKDNVLQMVSHDLKSPLSTLRNGLAILDMTIAAEIKANVRASKAVELIRQSTERMIALVRDVLDLARTEGRLVANFEMITLTPYLQRLVEEAAVVAADKQITLRFVPPPNDCRAMLAPQLFSLVLENLLSNAIKYTHAGGQVSLTVEVVEPVLRLRITDNGKGIAAEALPRLFEKFYRADTEQSGTGLGLAIVKTIVEQHQGQVSVESEVGKGSTFTVTLPHVPLPFPVPS